MSNPQPAAEVARRWDKVAQSDQVELRQGLIHPSGAHGEAEYRATGRSQAAMLLDLVTTLPGPEHRAHRVLDYGCGDGRVLAELSPVLEAWGTDTSPGMRDLALERCPGRAVVAPADVPAGHFDLVYCLAVLIHLGWNDGADLVRAMAAAVAPGGLLVLDVQLTAEPEEGGDWISVTTWSPARLQLLAEVVGFEVVLSTVVPWNVLQRPA